MKEIKIVKNLSSNKKYNIISIGIGDEILKRIGAESVPNMILADIHRMCLQFYRSALEQQLNYSSQQVIMHVLNIYFGSILGHKLIDFIYKNWMLPKEEGK